MTSFDNPWAARSTILARMTSRYDDVYFRARASSAVRSLPLSVTTNGLWRGIQTPSGQNAIVAGRGDHGYHNTSP